MRLHRDEVPVDAHLVHRLLRSQYPQFADRPLRLVDEQGTDNVVFRLGEDLSVRLPRKEGAVQSLLIELEWLPRLSRNLPLPVPMPIARGEPSEGYPFVWAICRWLHGTNPQPHDLRGHETAHALGTFVARLHSLDTTGGPVATPGTNRGGPLDALDHETRASLDEVIHLIRQGRIESDLLDPDAALSVWEAALEAAAWTQPGVWLHRDLHCANLLAANGILTGVLDFGGLVVGDPAGNVMAAWHVLSPEHRDTFRRITDADDATWTRARGWVLSQGLLALPYYLNTHSGMVRLARRAITQALQDVD